MIYCFLDISLIAFGWGWRVKDTFTWGAYQTYVLFTGKTIMKIYIL